MPVDYAEPTRLGGLKIEVLPNNSNTPLLVKEANSNIFTPAAEARGQLAVGNRNSSLGAVHNVPPKQATILSGDGYQTIDIKPNTSAAPRNQNLSRMIQDPTLPMGVTQVDVEGTAVLGKFLVGVYDQLLGINPIGNDQNTRRTNQREVFTPLENIGYAAGRRVVHGGQVAVEDAVSSSKRTLDDLWRKRPSFEIPAIEIPKISIPEIPQINLPEFPGLPEIALPKIKLPEPYKKPRPVTKPIPFEDLEELVRETEKYGCGRRFVHAAIIGLVTGFKEEFYDIVNPDGSVIHTNRYVPIEAPGTVEGYWQSVNGNLDYYYHVPPISDVVDLFEGEISGFKEEDLNGLKYKAVYGIDRKVQQDGKYNPFVGLQIPYYNTNHVVIDVHPAQDVGAVLDLFKSRIPVGKAFIIYHFTTDYIKDGCVIPQPVPEILSPPPPAPEKEDCECMCEKVNYPLIKALMLQTLQEQKFTIDVPVVTCEQNSQTSEWEPKTSTVSLEFFATSTAQALQLAQIHKENAKQASELCLARNGGEAIASLPLSWQIRHEGGKPQMVIQCAARKQNGKYGSANYPITVPHWKGGINDRPSLPPYRKGNYEGILVLADNSKVTINAANQAECTKILNALKPWIPKQMLEGSYFKGGTINTDIKVALVKPMYGRYFPTGQKNSKPEWRVDFP